MPSDALLLTDADLLPLTQDADVIIGAMDSLERATLALHTGGVNQATFQGRAAESNGRPSARLTLATGPGMDTGIRVQGAAPAADNRFYLLADGETGGLRAVMNFGRINPVRVGASGGLAARHMAPPNARILGVIGSSQQARTQVQAIVRAVPGLQQVLVYSPNPDHRTAFAAEMSSWLGVNAAAVGSIDEAVADADIITLAATPRIILLTPAQVKKGALIIDVSESQLDPAFVESARAVFVTWEGVANNPIAREPFSTPIKAGTFTKESLGAELGAVVAGAVNPRRTPDDVVIYVLTAANVHDLAIAQWAYGWAKANGVGTPLAL